MTTNPMTALPDRPPPSTASYILATLIVGACAGYILGQASSIGLFSSKSKSKPRPSSSSSSKSKPSWPNSYDVTLHPDTSDEELMTRLKGEDGAAAPGNKKKKKTKKKRRVRDSEEDDDESDESVESESEDEEEEEEEKEDDQQQDPAHLQTFDGNTDDCKLVLVVRTDLGMGKGKIAAQCGHATLACYRRLLSSSSSSPSSSTSTTRPTHPLLRRWEATGQAKIALQTASEAQLESLRAQAVRAGLCAEVVRDAGRTQVASGSATVLGVGPGPRGVVDGVTGGLRLL